MSEGGGAEAVKHAETHQFSLVKFTGNFFSFSKFSNAEINRYERGDVYRDSRDGVGLD